MEITNAIDEYILQFPEDIQEILNIIRKEVKEIAPNADERLHL